MIMDPRDATRPCMHAERRDARARTTSTSTPRCRRQSLGSLQGYVGGARMHECSQRCQTRHLVPSQAIPLPALPAQLSTSTPRNSAACRSIPARNLFCVPGVHLNQATQELCICSSLSPARLCLLLSQSTTIHLSSVSAVHRASSPSSISIHRPISPACRLF